MYTILVEISERWGGGVIFLIKKINGNSREEGGLCEIQSVVGVWIFSENYTLLAPCEEK